MVVASPYKDKAV